MIYFYFRLDAWHRDIDHWRERWEEFGVTGRYLEPRDFHLLAERLRETLLPGLKALEALQDAIPTFADFDKMAMDAYNLEGEDLRTILRELAEIAEKT
ncbi:MAG: hypothetical protein WD075_03810 [Rhodospirillales bacterium]